MNICSSQFGTKIFCSHPSSEFRDVNQLLFDFGKSERGYLAESFVRPPVFIMVSWCNQYNVNKISFKPSYGRHMIEKMSVRCIPKHAVETVNQENFKAIINQFKYTKSDIFINLASCKESQIVEINFVTEYCKSDEMSFIFNLIRRNIVMVLFEIIATKNTSLACLSDLRIYSRVKRKYVEFVEPDNVDLREPDLQETVANSNKFPDNYDSYPDDCLDPLTSEVLSNPVLLPCGKYVNLESLLKFWSSKSVDSPKYNPFTMVPLSDCQIQSSTTVDLVKKQQIADKIQEFLKRKEQFYNSILNPKKKYLKKDSKDSDSETDDEQLSSKLNEKISKLFPCLLNKKL